MDTHIAKIYARYKKSEAYRNLINKKKPSNPNTKPKKTQEKNPAMPNTQ
jgi:hypothetical protein